MDHTHSRIVILHGEVNEITTTQVILKLLDLESIDNTKPIYLYINSPGGSILSGLALMDTMNRIKAPVYTVCYGIAASMGSFLLSCGEKGHRYALPHCRILIHQPRLQFKSAYIRGQEELQRQAEGLTKTREKLEKFLSLNTGQPLEKIHADCEADNWLSAEEALAYGLIDKIMETGDVPEGIK